MKGKQFNITALLTLVNKGGDAMLGLEKGWCGPGRVLFSLEPVGQGIFGSLLWLWIGLPKDTAISDGSSGAIYWLCEVFLSSLVKIQPYAWLEIQSYQSRNRTRYRIRSLRLSASGQIESNVSKGSRQIGFVPLAKGLALGIELIGH